ncbi:unnamed protein product, partial [Tetraodon nigroviridis]
MVTRRLRSEYMKKFKDPKWETYTKCYEETLKYRLSRRLLEQTHKPWFWSGSDTDSDSGGRSPLPPPSHQAGAEPRGALGGQGLGPDGPVPGLPLQEEAGEIRVSAPRVGMEGKDGAGGTEGQEEAGAKQAGMPQSPKEPEKKAGQSKQRKASRSSRRCRRASGATAQPRGQDGKQRRPPFALYASGEKDASTAGRKTHNVCPAASTHEIHESALRAKMRREVERQIQTQRAERWRAKSADLVKGRKATHPEFNPWLTEYMRCFSVRS